MKSHNLVAKMLIAGALLGCGKEVTKPDHINPVGNLIYVSAPADPLEHPFLNSDIFRTDSDGGIEQLTFNLAYDTHPVLSPDGKLIAYQARRESGEGVYVMTTEGKNSQKVISANLNDINYAWSPDNNLLVFEKIDPEGRGTISVATLEGEITALTDSTSSNVDPSFSPGGKIIFSSNRNDPSNASRSNSFMYTMNVDGSDQKLERGYHGLHPKFSPDGLWIAYIDPSLADYGYLALMDAIGGYATVQLGDVLKDFVWSPTSRRIVYQSEIKLNLKEYDVTTDDFIDLTPPGSDARTPAYSPDGKNIVFSMGQGGNVDLYTVPSGGGKIQRVTNSPAMEIMPQWK